MKSSDIKILSLLSLGLFASCSTTVIDEKPVENYAIDFAEVSTRAAIDGSFSIGDSYSVWGWYVVNSSGVQNNVFDKTEVKYDGTSWKYDVTKYWSPDCTYSFYAVYPHSVDSNCTEDGKITIDGFDASTTGEGAIDLMTSKNVVTVNTSAVITPSAVQIPLSHELARIIFAVKAEDGLTVTLTKAKLYGVVYKGDYNSGETPVWTNLQTYYSNDTKFVYAPSSPSPLTQEGIDDVFSDILIIPNEDIEGVIFEITYFYDEFSYVPVTKKISVKHSSIPGWEKGKSYRYTVTIGPNNIQFEPVVTPWNYSTGGIITVE